jgi:CubicO group peptidase (beta-lactamase class C family)
MPFQLLRARDLILGACVLLSCSPLAAAPSPSREELARYADEILSRAYAAGEPGAAVLIQADGEEVLRKGYGLANVELGVPMRPETVFQIGSVSKQVTAAAILLLEERGKLSVSDDITKHLPGYPTHGQRITLEHLLAHTSGIPSYTGLAEWVSRSRDELTLEQLIAVFKDKPLEFAPGESWAYNNSGYILLGAVVEKVSGKSYEDFVEQEIFAPLGMKHSSYGSHGEVVPGRAAGYERGENGLHNVRYFSFSLLHAAGGLLSTVDDLAIWERALATGKVLSPVSVQRMLKPVPVNSGLSTKYGYGWGLWDYRGTRIAEHAGDIFGFAAQVLIVPSHGLTVVILANDSDREPRPEDLSFRIAAHALGRALEDRQPAALDAKTLDEYVGVYRFDERLARAITREGNQLFAQRTGGPKLPVFPAGRDELYYEDEAAAIRFRRGPEGKVVAMGFSPRFGLDAVAAKTAEALPSERKEVAVDPALYDLYTGTYELAPGFTMTFTREGGQLFVQPTGQAKVEIFPESETRFFLKVTDAQIVFERPGDGPATGLVFHQAGREVPAKRVP